MLVKMWGKGPSYTVGGNANYYNTMEYSKEAPQKLKVELLYDPARPFQGIYPKKCKSGYNKDTCTTMFIEALFLVAKLWKQPTCPTTDEWIMKMWHLHTMKFYSAIKKNEIFFCF
jgi:hypothetical protein